MFFVIIAVIIGIVITIWLAFKLTKFVRYERNKYYCKKTLKKHYGNEKGKKLYRFFLKIGKIK